MKKKSELPAQNESCNDLLKISWGRFCRIKVKHCLFFMMLIVFIMPRLYGNHATVRGTKARVLEAYELRINGKADKAEELLIELLKNDSTSALAHFELARTKIHLFLGGNKYSSEEWKEVMNSFHQAVRYAPDNEIFAFYYAYSCFFNAFISMMRQKPDVGENVTHTCDAFEAVLNIDPDCYEAMLYLVDIYGSLPEEMGGDKDKAGVYAEELKKKDRFYGALACSRLLPDTSDFVIYWQNAGKETGISARVMEELGRAYLLNSDTGNGTKYFEEAINADNTRRYLYLHLARYHILSIQENPDTRTEHLEEAEKLANSYLHSSPELTPPSKAYAYGILSLIKMIGKDDNGSNEYRELATSIDPFYSRAMGAPSEMLYCRPDEAKIHYSSFFLPF